MIAPTRVRTAPSMNPGEYDPKIVSRKAVNIRIACFNTTWRQDAIVIGQTEAD